MTTTPAIPFVALLPGDASEPITIQSVHGSLWLAVVDREQVGRLDESWDAAGVYILLDQHTADGAWGCYVGKAPSGLRTRLRQHARGKDSWRRALLIRRDALYGFHSGQCAWLEGRLHRMVKEAGDARVSNGNTPKDETLPPHELPLLDAVVDPVRRVLQLLGYNTTPGKREVPEPPAPQRITVTPSGAALAPPIRKKSGGRPVGREMSMLDMLQAGLVSAGEQLAASGRKHAGTTATVLTDGRVECRGTVYSTPSGAGTAVRNGGATNGWDFWLIARTGKTLARAQWDHVEGRA